MESINQSLLESLCINWYRMSNRITDYGLDSFVGTENVAFQDIAMRPYESGLACLVIPRLQCSDHGNRKLRFLTTGQWNFFNSTIEILYNHSSRCSIVDTCISILLALQMLLGTLIHYPPGTRSAEQVEVAIMENQSREDLVPWIGAANAAERKPSS